MNITPSYQPLQPGSNEPRKALAPVERAVQAHDPVGEQRAPAARLKVTDEVRLDAARIAERNRSNATIAEGGLRARRALSAYEGVARRDEREYVSSVLGIDEFA